MDLSSERSQIKRVLSKDSFLGTTEGSHQVEKFFEHAINGTLPENFTAWEICDFTGLTVAHKAAIHNNLPKGFDKWNLKNNAGQTVRDVYIIAHGKDPLM